MPNDQPFVIIDDPCNGLLPYALFAGFIIALPGPMRHKGRLVPLGILTIYALNVGRVAVRALTHVYRHPTVDFNHHSPFAFAELPGLTTHGLPVAIGYRLLHAVPYSSRIGLRIENVKFEPRAGREFLAKLGESVKEIEHGGFELAFGAVSSRAEVTVVNQKERHAELFGNPRLLPHDCLRRAPNQARSSPRGNASPFFSLLTSRRG